MVSLCWPPDLPVESNKESILQDLRYLLLPVFFSGCVFERVERERGACITWDKLSCLAIQKYLLWEHGHEPKPEGLKPAGTQEQKVEGLKQAWAQEPKSEGLMQSGTQEQQHLQQPFEEEEAQEEKEPTLT